VIFAVISIGLLIALIVILTKDDTKEELCKAGMGVNVATSSSSPGLFDDLTSQEIKKVYEYMFTVKALDLTANKELKINSNTIALVQFYPPSKDKALAYLDQNDKPTPERQAIVVVFKGAAQPPVVEEYIVGPASAPTKHELRQVDGRKYPINFNARPFSTQDGIVMDKLIFKDLGVKTHDLLIESYDGYAYGDNCGKRCLYSQFAAPMGYTSDTRENWFGFWRYELAFYVHPLNFEFYVNHAGSDPSKWRIEKLLYNEQLFDSVEALMGAYRNGTLVKTFIPALNNEEKLLFTYERRGKEQPSKPMRGPQLYEPDGKRYTVRGRHVEYMNWAFDFRVDTSTGLQVHDVRFGGDRIVYEISLQEAIATYTGFYPTQMSNNFLDSNYFMGVNSHDLLQGVYRARLTSNLALGHARYDPGVQGIVSFNAH
jgi:diamine oxidase